MLPLININTSNSASNNSIKSGDKRHRNKTEHHNENQSARHKETNKPKKQLKRKRKLWMDKSIPQSIDEIYESCLTRLDEVKRDLDQIDLTNCMDSDNLFDTLNFYSIHLHELNDFMGVSEIKAFKTMKHICDVVKSKVKTQNELLKKEKDTKKKKLLPDLYEKHRIDEFDEDFIRIEQELTKSEAQLASLTVENEIKLPAIVNTEQNSNGQSPVKETDTAAGPLSPSTKYEKVLVTQDPIITPILIAHRNRRLIIDQATEENTDILSELLERIQDGIHDKYRTPIDEIVHIAKIFEKYLLSFLLTNSQNFLESQVKNDETELDTYNRNLIRTDILLDAPIKYDKKRLYYINFIKKSVKSLDSLKAKFNDGTYKGISLDDLSHENRTLSKRFDLRDIPVVLILPEFSIVLNKCLKILHEWLIYDKEYTCFVETDTKDIEKRKKNLNAIKHGSEVLYNDIIYKIKLAKNALDSHEQEIADTCKKNQVKMYWLKDVESRPPPKLKINPELSHLDCRSMLEKISVYLSKQEADIPKLNCQIDKNTFKNKQMIMEEKYRQFDYLRSDIINTENQLNYLYEEKKVKQNELDILENCHLKLKTILMYKSSSETLNKIYFDLPLPATKFALTDNKSIELLKMNIQMDEDELKKKAIVSKDDQFSIGISLIANMLDNDWIKFYYALPFYPERGAHNIKKDIDDVFLKFNRGDVLKEQSYFSLQKWKRFHSRAKLDDLRDALKVIGRLDILNHLNNHLKQLREPKIEIKPDTKKTSIEIEDMKKKEIEMLHEKLTKYFERIRTGDQQEQQLHFKFFTKT